MANGPSDILASPEAVVTLDHGPAPTIAYQPALDGVRALAVLVVLLFHGGVAGFGGGYLGVSVFFTLSGYLITTLLSVEMRREGRLALGSFYARRARRLLPASIVVLLFVAVAAVVTDWFDAIDGLRAEIVGSLLQVANWVFLASEGSYQDLLETSAGAASPVEHYWSLAIEEQFYWLWPIAFLGLWRLGRTHRGRVAALSLLTLLAVVAAPVIARVWGPDAAYWATPARAAEILLGALVALVLLGRTVPAGAATLAPLALVVLGACVVWFPSAGGPAYAGWLPAIGVMSATLLVGLQAESATRRWCSSSPLVWLGRISYGVYLFHWPIFVVVNEERVGIEGPLLLAVRLVLTLGIAQLSYVFVEQPIRRGVASTPRRTLLTAAGCTAAAVAVAVVLVPASDGSYWRASASASNDAAIVVDDRPLEAEPAPVDDSGGSVTDDGTDDGAGADRAVDAEAVPDDEDDEADLEPVPVPSRPVRVLVVGDSTAEAIGAGLVGWAVDEPASAQVEVRSAPGCGFVRGGEFLNRDEWTAFSPGCVEFFYQSVPDEVAALSPDVVVLVTGPWDVLDRRWSDEGDEPVTVFDAAGRVDDDFTELTRRFLDAGVQKVVWVQMPVPDPEWAAAIETTEDAERHAVLHDVMTEIAERFPDRVGVVDLDGWVDARGWATDRDVRPDGVHFTVEASTTVAVEYLGDQLLRAALDGPQVERSSVAPAVGDGSLASSPWNG